MSNWICNLYRPLVENSICFSLPPEDVKVWLQFKRKLQITLLKQHFFNKTLTMLSLHLHFNISIALAWTILYNVSHSLSVHAAIPAAVSESKLHAARIQTRHKHFKDVLRTCNLHDARLGPAPHVPMLNRCWRIVNGARGNLVDLNHGIKFSF